MSKVLLIEDDPMMQDLYRAIFTLENHQLIVATRGKIGLEKATSDKPDLILLDVMMPEMNGLDVLEHLKSDTQTAAIPVVMLTNVVNQEIAEQALKKGAEQYVVKSDHDPEEVLELVNQILKKHQPS